MSTLQAALFNCHTHTQKTMLSFPETNSFLLPVKQSQNTIDQNKTHESTQYTGDK